jgi:hypothetical protein
MKVLKEWRYGSKHSETEHLVAVKCQVYITDLLNLGRESARDWEPLVGGCTGPRAGLDAV